MSDSPASVATIPDDEAAQAAELKRLQSRVVELEQERDHLVTVVEILQQVSESLHFVDVLQAIARRLGETFGLDRCSIFLTGDSEEVRLVASYEDPAIRNLVVDIRRYPELRRALESGETVFIPDALSEPMLEGVRGVLDLRKVRSIIVVPIRWRGTVIGAIFLRTERDGATFSDADVRFCQIVASLTAKALHNAHRYEAAVRASKEGWQGQRRAELQRVALIGFLKRLLERHTQAEDQVWSESLLPAASDEELQRLVTVAMQVIDEEAKG